jgi:hypothetical protein
MLATEMTSRHKWFWLAGAFAVCFFGAGAIWWRGTYQDYLYGAFRWETVPLLAGVALMLSWVSGVGVFASAIAVGSAFPAVVFARVVLDCMENPTSHNLWPFEVAMAFGVGMIMSFPSAAFGWLLRRVTNRHRAEPDAEE